MRFDYNFRFFLNTQNLVKKRSGTLSKQEFLEIKELQGNPLLDRVIDVFDENRDGEIQFTEFISSLAVFSQNGNDEAKLKCNPKHSLCSFIY